MERRRDYRHGLSYSLSLKCRRSGAVFTDLSTADVSASGLLLRAAGPLRIDLGDRFELQLFARVQGRDGPDTLVMATDAVVVRRDGQDAALRFEAPLSY